MQYIQSDALFSDYNGHQYLTEAAMSLVYYSLVSPISEQFQPGTGCLELQTFLRT